MQKIIYLLLATSLSLTALAQQKNTGNGKTKIQVTKVEEPVLIEGNNILQGDRKLGHFNEQVSGNGEERMRTMMFYSAEGTRVAMINMKGPQPTGMEVTIFKTGKKSIVKLTSEMDITPPGLARYVVKQKAF